MFRNCSFGSATRRLLIGKQRQRRFRVHRGDPSDKLPGAAGVEPKRAAQLVQRYRTLDGVLEAGLFKTQADMAPPLSVDRDAERNKVRHLVWIDAVSLPDLLRPDARYFPAPRRVQDRRARRGELKRIPIAARHQCRAACALLSRNCGGEKVVGLVPWGFGVRKRKRGD